MAVLLGKIKSTKERKEATDLLKFIVEGTNGPAGNARVPLKMVQQIDKAQPGLLTTQGEADPGGNIVVSATPEAIQAVTGGEIPKTSSAFELDDVSFIPPTQRGGIRPETYPFGSMQVKQSFFVAATEERPHPEKTMISTINSANKRFASVYPQKKGKEPHPQAGQPTGKDGRKFSMRARKAGDPLYGPDGKTVIKTETANGVRIWRDS